jgi:hypothetical protein
MRFYKIKIGSLWLTKDGLETGDECKLSVSGASDLLDSFSGSVNIAADGTPIVQTFETGTKGKILEIKVSTVYADVWTSIVNLINTALGDSATINITGAGVVGDFDVDCFPLLPKPFEATEFINGRIKDAIFRFITT